MGELTGLSELRGLQAQLLTKAETWDGPLVSFECEQCQDLQWVGRPARPCECQERKRKARMLASLVRQLGKRYEPFELESLEPMPSRHWKQGVIIKRMRQEPHASWAFFGEKGIGKTLFAFVLAKHAIESGRYTVAISLHELMNQLRDYQFNDEARPAITADTLRDAKTPWCIVLDDISAVSPSQFVGQQILSIVNAIYADGRHQLITTCMKREAALQQHFETAGDGFGIAILRRILDDPNVLKPSQLFDMEPPANLKLVQQAA